MKKLLMIAALSMLGSAFAAGTVTVTVNATVSNVCVFSGTSNDAKTNNSNVTLTTMTYNASAGGNTTGTAYTVQCTSGTVLTNGGDAKGSNVALNLNKTPAATALAVTYSDNLVKTSTAGSGDTYTMGMTVSAAAGQWDATSGSYSGTVTYSLDYN